jgi:hypothetical protein
MPGKGFAFAGGGVVAPCGEGGVPGGGRAGRLLRLADSVAMMTRVVVNGLGCLGAVGLQVDGRFDDQPSSMPGRVMFGTSRSTGTDAPQSSPPGAAAARAPGPLEGTLPTLPT